MGRLAESMRETCEGILELKNEIRGFAEDRKKIKEEVRKNVEEVRETIAESQKDREELAKDREELAGEVRETIAESQKDREELAKDREELVGEVREMHEEWQRLWRMRPTLEEIERIPEVKIEEEEEIRVAEPELGILKDRMLEVINSSPHGISLVGIGLRLGVEWRKLIRPAKKLLSEGNIRKEDVNYYPIR